MRIAVYFNSGYKSVFDAKNVVFQNGEKPELPESGSGVVVINWGNVCFIKTVEEKQNDDE